MSLEYAEGRIKEALRLSKGNATKARQQIMAWTYEDPKLLQALCRPHLTGIAAHAVSRVIYRQDLEEETTVPEVAEGIDMPPSTFGAEILKSLQSNNTAMFGFEGNVPPVSRKQASKSHIDALKRMADKKGGENEDQA